MWGKRYPDTFLMLMQTSMIIMKDNIEIHLKNENIIRNKHHVLSDMWKLKKEVKKCIGSTGIL